MEIFSTGPQSKDVEQPEYLRRLSDVARWSEEAGHNGILIHSADETVDPWLVSRVILESTTTLCPVVAVQPAYMHPYTVAKMVATLGFLHGRRVCLNMLAGGFRSGLVASDGESPDDERYARTVEYALIVKNLLAGGPVTFAGRYYTVTNLRMTPPLPEELFPGILISGSSEAGLEAARTIGATAVRYPKPPGDEEDQRGEVIDTGIRVGVIARETGNEAWRVAHGRFPEDRNGQNRHSLAMQEENPYWLWPFQSHSTFCPYLVGSYDRVGQELGSYMELGYKCFILDVPPSREELEHTSLAFAQAGPHATR